MTSRLLLSRWAGVLAATAAVSLAATALFGLFAPVPDGASPIAWWIARGGGFVAYLSLALTMWLGLMMSWRGLSGRLDQRRAWRLHDLLALAVVVATALHILAVLFVVLVERVEAVVAPLPATFGVLGTVGLVLLFGSRWLVRRMSTTAWRASHRLAYAIFLVALAHAGTAGSGVVEPSLRWFYLLVGATLAGAGLFRFMFGAMGGASADGRAARAAAGRERDELTGLEGAASFTANLERAIDRARGRGESLALLYINLDRFTVANGLYGERTCDHLLWCVAQRLRSCGRARDLVARVGGDEFAIAVRGRGADSDCLAVARRALEAIAQPHLEHGGVTVTASIGIGVYPADAWDADGLLRSATMAMFRAKVEGGCTYFQHAEAGIAAA